jgi:hypothetical protein
LGVEVSLRDAGVGRRGEGGHGGSPLRLKRDRVAMRVSVDDCGEFAEGFTLAAESESLVEGGILLSVNARHPPAADHSRGRLCHKLSATFERYTRPGTGGWEIASG